MYGRMIRNGIARSKTLSVALASFIAAAALLVSLAATLTMHLALAIDSMMEKAVTPHFMQMHTGSVDIPRLRAFAEGRDDVEAFQVKEFLNVEGERFVLGGRSLGGSVQDNGLTTQGRTFDYLLNMDGERIQVRDGEIYVPVSYMKDRAVRAGDVAFVYGKPFRVAGFLRDSQMNSPLASSKRFLVSEGDYAGLRGSGSVEYLIEFRLKSEESIGTFETAYAAAGLESNGPTITYPLFKFVNAISDGLMIAVILLVSVLVTLIAFLCVRFALLAQIEDEYREIGVLKGIGLRVSDIKRLYLVKYATLAAVGSVAGAALAVPCRVPLLANIRLTMGEGGNDAAAFAFGLLGALFVFLAVIAFVNASLGRFGMIPAAEAIRIGAASGNRTGARWFTVERGGALGANVFLGIKDILSRMRLYATMLAVFAFSLFIMLVPRALFRTISSEDFIAYMGIGRSDLRIDIQQTDDIPRKAAEIAAALEADRGIAGFVSLTTVALAVRTAEGKAERVKVELGDHSAFPVAYSSGRAPVGEREIALSSLNAQAWEKKVGDTLRLLVGGDERDFTVTGIYSDITNGGRTAKAAFSDAAGVIMWCVISVALSDPSTVTLTVDAYAGLFPFAKVSGIRDYVRQTFGPTIAAIRKASYAAILVAWVIAALITLLFMRLLVVKDLRAIAVMKALGFRYSEIRAQYLTRIACVLVAALACGTFLTGTLGEAIAGGLLSAFGASSFSFAADPAATYILYPLLLAAPVAASAFLGASRIRGISVAENSKE